MNFYNYNHLQLHNCRIGLTHVKLNNDTKFMYIYYSIKYKGFMYITNWHEKSLNNGNYILLLIVC